MPGMDLSTLNSEQLRNILDAARARNQQELTEEVLSELHARRGRAPGPRFFAREEPVAEPPEAWWDGLREEAELDPAPPTVGKAQIVGGLLGAVALSAALGWWLTLPGGRSAPDAPPAASEPARGVVTLPVAPLAPPPPREAHSPSVAPRPMQVARAEPSGHASPKRSASAHAAPRKSGDPCRAEATPADRLVCSNSILAARHREMRAAYDRAIRAGADPLVIDRDQAEWRAIRNGVKDPSRLTTLYNRRIRELDAAARAADDEPPI